MVGAIWATSEENLDQLVSGEDWIEGRLARSKKRMEDIRQNAVQFERTSWTSPAQRDC